MCKNILSKHYSAISHSLRLHLRPTAARYHVPHTSSMFHTRVKAVFKVGIVLVSLAIAFHECLPRLTQREILCICGSVRCQWERSPLTYRAIIIYEDPFMRYTICYFTLILNCLYFNLFSYYFI